VPFRPGDLKLGAEQVSTWRCMVNYCFCSRMNNDDRQLPLKGLKDMV